MSSVSSTGDGEHTQPDNLTHLQQTGGEDTVTVCHDAFEPSTVDAKFWDTTVKLTEMLQSFDPQMIADNCGLLRASTQANIPLFPTHYMKVLQGSRSTPTLVQKLSAFANWMDHSVLTAVVEACNIPEVAALLAQFDSRIDTSQPVTKYPIPSPSHHMVPYDTSIHTVLAVQLNLQLSHFNLKNLIDIRSLIQKKCEVTPHCLQLLAVAKTSHTIIYWTVPKHVASFIVLNVLQHQSYFYQNGIQQVAVYPKTILTIGSALTVGPFSFFAKVSSLTRLK